MLRKAIVFSGSLSALIVTVILFIFSEGLLILSVGRLGVINSVIIFSAASFPICWMIHWLYETGVQKSGLLNTVDSWVRSRERRIGKRWIQIANTSKPLAVLLFCSVSGVFLTTIFLELLGFRQKAATLFIAANVLFFYCLWAFIYSGAFEVLGRLPLFTSQ